MSTRPLHVLVVSTDRKLLRHLSRFLQDFGYVPHAAADARSCLTAIDAVAPDIVVVDGELTCQSGVELCRQLRDWPTIRPRFMFLLAKNPSLDEVLEALEAGVDDVLGKPVVYGEYLARFRAAARSLEHQRRYARQQGRDPITGLRNREAFLEYLQRLNDDQVAHGGQGGRDAALACVVLDLDHFARVNVVHGRQAGDALLREVAEYLESCAGEDAAVFNLSEDRFGVVLSGQSEANAVLWAEKTREALAGTAFRVAETPVEFTATFGVYACQLGSRTPDEILDHVSQALASAKRSGRNCVARANEFAGEQRAWDDLAAPGKLFESTTARDVMTPCTATVTPDDTVATAAQLRRRSAADVVPVVDERHKLVGALVFDGEWPDVRYSTPTAHVGDVMCKSVSRFAPGASLATLLDFFSRDASTAAVIVDADRPLGYVTRDSLGALIRPVTTASFAPPEPYDASSDYLVVPDVAVAG